MIAVEEDLFVLKYTVPSTREEADKVFAILLEELGSRERLIYELGEIESNLVEVENYLAKTASFDPKLLEYLRGLEKTRERLERIARETSDDKVAGKTRKLLVEIEELIELIKERIIS